GMRRNGYPPAFADRIFGQIRGFAEYGFPESHSASFALLAYVSSWLKHYEPAAFLAAMLNSQPMGFYTASQLVQDARRHGAEVGQQDAMISNCECTRETAAGCEPRAASREPSVVSHQPTVRLGLLMIKGLSQTVAERMASVRAEQAFADVADLARRCSLNQR